MRRLAGCLTATALVAAVACANTSLDRGGSTPQAGLAACVARSVVSEGEKLPDCSFEGLEGEQDLRIASLLGKPSILNFWASWCPQCIDEMPDFDAVNAQLGGAVTFVGLNVLHLQGETRGAAERFRERTGVRYRMVYDPDGAFYARFQPNVLRPIMPITIFADAEGIVVRKKFGQITHDQLLQAVDELFGVVP